MLTLINPISASEIQSDIVFLTDRVGTIDLSEDADEAEVNALNVLEQDAALLSTLRALMHHEDMFVVLKDGEMGFLMEVELPSMELEGRLEIAAHLRDFQAYFDSLGYSVGFFVPENAMVWDNRSAAWAFIKLPVSADQLELVRQHMHSLYDEFPWSEPELLTA